MILLHLLIKWSRRAQGNDKAHFHSLTHFKTGYGWRLLSKDPSPVYGPSHSYAIWALWPEESHSYFFHTFLYSSISLHRISSYSCCCCPPHKWTHVFPFPWCQGFPWMGVTSLHFSLHGREWKAPTRPDLQRKKSVSLVSSSSAPLSCHLQHVVCLFTEVYFGRENSWDGGGEGKPLKTKKKLSFGFKRVMNNGGLCSLCK